ncbi:MAG: tetratricopeptide repeat protein, partial [Planctomycetes bacterium]|nr:tetratricopeptide repeat protein [Planctomycetota bacterium]
MIAVAAWTAAAIAVGQTVLPPNLGVPDAAPVVPGPGYDLVLAALAGGDYANALEAAERDHRSGVVVAGDRWIDSIASATMLGECLFEVGRLRDAVARYEEALAVAAAQPNWLLAVRFPAEPLLPLRRPLTATWGRSKRNAVPAAIPETMTI